jgi:hypothetical protein
VSPIFANGATTAALAQAMNGEESQRQMAARNDAEQAFIGSLNSEQREYFENFVNSQGTGLSDVSRAIVNFDNLVESLSADQSHMFARAVGASPGNLLDPSFGDLSKGVSESVLNVRIRRPLVELQRRNAWNATGLAGSVVYGGGSGTIVRYVATAGRARWIGTAYEGYGHIR